MAGKRKKKVVFRKDLFHELGLFKKNFSYVDVVVNKEGVSFMSLDPSCISLMVVKYSVDDFLDFEVEGEDKFCIDVSDVVMLSKLTNVLFVKEGDRITIESDNLTFKFNVMEFENACKNIDKIDKEIGGDCVAITEPSKFYSGLKHVSTVSEIVEFVVKGKEFFIRGCSGDREVWVKVCSADLSDRVIKLNLNYVPKIDDIFEIYLNEGKPVKFQTIDKKVVCYIAPIFES